jgi:hypothetical protein
MTVGHCGLPCNRMLRFNILREEIEASASSNLPLKAIYIKGLISDSNSASDDLDSVNNNVYHTFQMKELMNSLEKKQTK